MAKNYTKWPQHLPNIRNLNQMALKYTNIFHCKALQNLPKLGFLFENMPSGNPGGDRKKHFFRRNNWPSQARCFDPVHAVGQNRHSGHSSSKRVNESGKASIQFNTI
jgi:hypothetical protein